jgi:hypothetical protein
MWIKEILNKYKMAQRVEELVEATIEEQRRANVGATVGFFSGVSIFNIFSGILEAINRGGCFIAANTGPIVAGSCITGTILALICGSIARNLRLPEEQVVQAIQTQILQNPEFEENTPGITEAVNQLPGASNRRLSFAPQMVENPLRKAEQTGEPKGKGRCKKCGLLKRIKKE